MTSIKLDKVTKLFEQEFAVSDLSIEVAERELLVFLGPSGSGKTTILQLIAGLESASTGEIYIGDQAVGKLQPWERDVALVPSPTLSLRKQRRTLVRDYIALDLGRRGITRKEIERRVRTAAQMVNMETRLDRKLEQLSGSEPLRAGIARAIAIESSVLMMDDPLCFVDAPLLFPIRSFFRDLHRQLQITLIYATRNWVDALTIGDRVAVIKPSGTLQQVASPRMLYDNPKTVFVAGFIGDPGMNFFSARLTDRRGKVVADCRDFAIEVPGSKAAFFRPYTGMDVILGFRPEHIYLPGYTSEGIKESVAKAQVEMIEFRGAEVIAQLVTKSQPPFFGRFDPHTDLCVGNEVSVTFDLNRMHIFDRETEMAIR